MNRDSPALRRAKDKYNKTEKGMRANREAQRRYRQNHSDRTKAHDAVYRAVKNGRLVRPDTCSRCGEGGTIQASHDDYERRLDIEWLCVPCHIEKDRDR